MRIFPEFLENSLSFEIKSLKKSVTVKFLSKNFGDTTKYNGLYPDFRVLKPRLPINGGFFS